MNRDLKWYDAWLQGYYCMYGNAVPDAYKVMSGGLSQIMACRHVSEEQIVID